MWAKHKQFPGFTIVELLIVIVVIAILAAVTVTAYNGIQNRAYNAAVRSDLSTIGKKLELYRAASASNYYPTSNAELDSAGFAASLSSYYTPTDRANFYYCTDTANPTQYAIGAISKSKQGYYMLNGKITEFSSDSSGSLWGSSTCAEAGLVQGNAGILSSVAYNNTNATWADWVK